jgi:DNA-binding CsgD family transcriptional regulator
MEYRIGLRLTAKEVTPTSRRRYRWEDRMLEALGPGRPPRESARFLPQVLSPLVTAADRGESLVSAVAAIVRILGFDSFMYGTSLCPRPDGEEKSYVFTTLPSEWVSRYDQRAYIEVDPRVLHTFESAMPLIWDQHSERGRNAATDAFLEDAALHGVASGVTIAIYCAREGHVVVAFNSTQPDIDELRRFEIARNIGDLFLLGVYFHEMFMKTVIERGLPPSSQGAPLSPQEKKCLSFAAHGFTSRQIAAELHISERMVELHFSHLRSKLSASNRQEAIAKAFAEGMIRRGEISGLNLAAYRPEDRSSRVMTLQQS